ncbi:hypothetical protein BOQ55_13490 [Lacticaseibacillus casei]|nr:hypothetical protein BOQ55_13490 [Lacticaseibacillus casei]
MFPFEGVHEAVHTVYAWTLLDGSGTGGVELGVLLKHRLGATPLPPLSVQISCRISKVNQRLNFQVKCNDDNEFLIVV